MSLVEKKRERKNNLLVHRQVKWKRGFTAPTEPNVDSLIHLTPASIVDYKTDDSPIRVYEEQGKGSCYTLIKNI